MAGRYRPRRQFRFLLYQDIAMELTLTDYILKLKASKQFVTTVKNALRLIGSLQERDLSVLYELFPWIGEAIRAQGTKPPDSDDLDKKISAAVAVGVQTAMMNMPSLPATPLVGAPLKPASAPPKVETKAAPKMSASDIADNFLLSMG